MIDFDSKIAGRFSTLRPRVLDFMIRLSLNVLVMHSDFGGEDLSSFFPTFVVYLRAILGDATTFSIMFDDIYYVSFNGRLVAIIVTRQSWLIL